MARNKYPEETAKRILDTAARLFTEKGYDHTSLQDIIDETGLSKGAIDHHFASKDEILVRICERIGQENIVYLSSIRDDKALNGKEKLTAIFKAALNHTNQHQVISMKPYLLNNPRFLALQIKDIYDDVVPHYMLPILEQGIADGSLHAEHPRELAEAVMILTNVWLNPLLLPTSAESMKARCAVFTSILEGVGMDIVEEGMLDSYLKYNNIINGYLEEP